MPGSLRKADLIVQLGDLIARLKPAGSICPTAYRNEVDDLERAIAAIEAERARQIDDLLANRYRIYNTRMQQQQYVDLNGCSGRWGRGGGRRSA